MNNPIRRIVFALLLLCTATVSLAGSDAPYLIQAGDVLSVTVWKEPELQQEVLVRPDGGMSFPLVGDIQVAGKTLPEVNAMIKDSLARFIPDPEVTVGMRQIMGNSVYVIGKVNKPGMFPASSYVDVVQALSIAGGLTPFAAVNDIVVLRRTADGNLQAIPFRFAEIEDGINLEQNIMLQNGDIVLVP